MTKLKTTEIRFEIPEEILNSLNQGITEFIKESMLYTAMQFYKNHKLSFGKAAELAGLSKDAFLKELDKNDIDFINYSPSELENEMNRFER